LTFLLLLNEELSFCFLTEMRDELNDKYDTIDEDFRRQDKAIRTTHTKIHDALQPIIGGCKEVMKDWKGQPKAVHGKIVGQHGYMYYEGLRLSEKVHNTYMDDHIRLRTETREERRLKRYLMKTEQMAQGEGMCLRSSGNSEEFGKVVELVTSRKITAMGKRIYCESTRSVK
jgi:hypothetical protein